jgi:hypothetical protein
MSRYTCDLDLHYNPFRGIAIFQINGEIKRGQKMLSWLLVMNISQTNWDFKQTAPKKKVISLKDVII